MISPGFLQVVARVDVHPLHHGPVWDLRAEQNHIRMGPCLDLLMQQTQETGAAGLDLLTSYLGASFHESSWKEKESPRKFRWKSCSAAT